MKSILAGGILGGIALFAWCTVSWMFLPWHNATFRKFDQERVVEVVLQTNAPQKGIYLLPSPATGTPEEQKTTHERAAKGPFAFVVMSPNGWGPMPFHIATGLLTQILGAGLVTGLLVLVKKPKAAFVEKFSFVVLFALAAGVVCHLPFWNWWGFSIGFTLLSLADLLIGWSLAGLVIAKVTS